MRVWEKSGSEGLGEEGNKGMGRRESEGVGRRSELGCGGRESEGVREEGYIRQLHTCISETILLNVTCTELMQKLYNVM